MNLNEQYLIVQKPALIKQWYSEKYESQDGWREGIRRIRAAMPFTDPINYRGISREPLSPLWTTDLEELRKSADANKEEDVLIARIRIKEISDSRAKPGQFNLDEAALDNLEQALEVYNLLEGDSRDQYEIIRLTRNNEVSIEDTLGYDVGYWSGDYFSIICDTSITPLWHPPAFEDIEELAQQLNLLNRSLLFNTKDEAKKFREYYRSKSWAETEFKKDEFCIIRVDECKL